MTRSDFCVSVGIGVWRWLSIGNMMGPSGNLRRYSTIHFAILVEAGSSTARPHYGHPVEPAPWLHAQSQGDRPAVTCFLRQWPQSRRMVRPSLCGRLPSHADLVQHLKYAVVCCSVTAPLPDEANHPVTRLCQDAAPGSTRSSNNLLAVVPARSH